MQFFWITNVVLLIFFFSLFFFHYSWWSGQRKHFTCLRELALSQMYKLYSPPCRICYVSCLIRKGLPGLTHKVIFKTVKTNNKKRLASNEKYTYYMIYTVVEDRNLASSVSLFSTKNTDKRVNKNRTWYCKDNSENVCEKYIVIRRWAFFAVVLKIQIKIRNLNWRWLFRETTT